MPLAPTPKDAILRDGTATLYHFRPSANRAPAGAAPLLLVPSMINRWYVLDLKPGASVAQALVEGGVDTYLLDWGIANDEDRYFTWEDVMARLARMARKVRRESGAKKIGLLGYCMGATLSAIHAALHPDEVAALANLAGPIDFSKAGFLRHMVDPEWFDVNAIANAGNMTPEAMQSGFQALRPTQNIAKLVNYVDRMHDPAAREAFDILEEWANDNVPFPAEAYRGYIRDIYQGNQLVEGTHYVAGKRADLGSIRCPVLTITADRDTIVPTEAAMALAERSNASEKEHLSVPGGHVGAVIGSRASKVLYPAMTAWFRKVLAPRPAATATASAPASA
jgi:polyhydroxyalkanoate synthase